MFGVRQLVVSSSLLWILLFGTSAACLTRIPDMRQLEPLGIYCRFSSLSETKFHFIVILRLPVNNLHKSSLRLNIPRDTVTHANLNLPPLLPKLPGAIHLSATHREATLKIVNRKRSECLLSQPSKKFQYDWRMSIGNRKIRTKERSLRERRLTRVSNKNRCSGIQNQCRSASYLPAWDLGVL